MNYGSNRPEVNENTNCIYKSVQASSKPLYWMPLINFIREDENVCQKILTSHALLSDAITIMFDKFLQSKNRKACQQV